MKKLLSLLCVSYFILCCENKKEVVNNKLIKSTLNTKEEKMLKPDLKPLFLGLSPNMSNQEFQLKIKQLNSEGVLDYNNFDISSGNDVISFSVTKTENTIRLETSDSILSIFSPEDGTTGNSSNTVGEYIEKKNKILKIYQDKYNKSKVQIPEGINLSTYKLSKDKYILFTDQDKYVIFGYSLMDGGYPVDENRREVKIHNNSEDGDSFTFGLNSIKSDSEFQSKTISLEIQIDYIDADEMNTLLNKMKAEKQIKVEKQKKINLDKYKKDIQKEDNIKNI